MRINASMHGENTKIVVFDCNGVRIGRQLAKRLWNQIEIGRDVYMILFLFLLLLLLSH